MNKKKLYETGIYIQRNETKFKQFNGFCITFPRLGNLDKKLENEIMFPLNGFKTFNQAFKEAIRLRDSISYLKKCPIVNHCDFEENKSYCYKFSDKVIA